MKKLYIAYWSNRDITIIKASNINQARLYLDHIGDPFSCQIKEYDGPIFFDFKAPKAIKYMDSEDPVPVRGREEIFEDEKPKYHAPFSKFFNSKEFSDTELIVGSKVIPCHKIVLSTVQNFQNKLENATLKLKGISEEILLVILCFIYRGNIQDQGNGKNLEFWFDVFQVVLFFNLPTLEDLVENKMVETFRNSENSFIEKQSLLSDPVDKRVENIISWIEKPFKLGAAKFVDILLSDIALQAPNIFKEAKNISKELKTRFKSIQKENDRIFWVEEGISTIFGENPYKFSSPSSCEIASDMWSRFGKMFEPKIQNFISEDFNEFQELDSFKKEFKKLNNSKPTVTDDDFKEFLNVFTNGAFKL
jgi:hypothetical protein